MRVVEFENMTNSSSNNNDNNNYHQRVQIKPSDLKQKIDSHEDVFILDVRTQEEYESWKLSYNGYDNSLLVPLDTLRSSSSNVLSQIPKGKEIVTLCSHGNRSMLAAKFLSQLGYDVKSIEGGLSAWNNVYDITFIPVVGKNLSSIVRIWQLRRVSKGCIGYLVSSEIDKNAVIIDPTCEINEPLAKVLKDNNLHLTKVIDTHLHADHISGASRLAKIYGAEVYISSLEDYDIKEKENDDDDDEIVFNQIEDDNKIDIDKRVSLMAIHTPGHTNGSMCFRLVIDDIDNEGKYNNNNDHRNNNDANNISSRTTAYLFTGDTIFVNGIGRPDLQHKAKEFTHNLYDTYQQKILSLPKETIILPAHFSDSFEHEKPIYDTLELINKRVKVLLASKEQFMEFVLGSIPSRQPLNYDKIIEINKSMVPCDKVEIADLEAGPNSCGIQT